MTHPIPFIWDIQHTVLVHGAVIIFILTFSRHWAQGIPFRIRSIFHLKSGWCSGCAMTRGSSAKKKARAKARATEHSKKLRKDEPESEPFVDSPSEGEPLCATESGAEPCAEPDVAERDVGFPTYLASLFDGRIDVVPPTRAPDGGLAFQLNGTVYDEKWARGKFKALIPRLETPDCIVCSADDVASERAATFYKRTLEKFDTTLNFRVNTNKYTVKCGHAEDIFWLKDLMWMKLKGCGLSAVCGDNSRKNWVRLTFNGQELLDERELQDYGIRNGDELVAEIGFQVQIRTVSGRSIVVDPVFSSDSVAFFLDLIEKKSSVPKGWIYCSFNGTVLEEERSVGSYGITGGSVVSMSSHGLRGGVRESGEGGNPPEATESQRSSPEQSHENAAHSHASAPNIAIATSETPMRAPGDECPGGCGYLITWHKTHCCFLCAKVSGEHGPRCDKKRAGDVKAERPEQDPNAPLSEEATLSPGAVRDKKRSRPEEPPGYCKSRLQEPDLTKWYVSDIKWPHCPESRVNEMKKNQNELRDLGAEIVTESVDAMNVGAFLRARGLCADDVVLAVFHGICSRIGANDYEYCKTQENLHVQDTKVIACIFAALTAALPQATVIVTATGHQKQVDIRNTCFRQTMTRPVVCRKICHPPEINGTKYAPESNGIRHDRLKDSMPWGFVAVGPAIGAEVAGVGRGDCFLQVGPLVLQACASGGVLLFLGEFTCTNALHMAKYAQANGIPRPIPRRRASPYLPKEMMCWKSRDLYDYEAVVAHCCEKLEKKGLDTKYVGMHAAQLWLFSEIHFTNMYPGSDWLPTNRKTWGARTWPVRSLIPMCPRRIKGESDADNATPT